MTSRKNVMAKVYVFFEWPSYIKQIQLYTWFEIILTCDEFDSLIMDRIFWKFNFSDQRYYQQQQNVLEFTQF